MAGILWTRRSLLETLAELAGFKAGLILSPDEVLSRLPEYANLLVGHPEEFVRTRAEEFEALVQSFLFDLGAVPSTEPVDAMDLYAKYFPDTRKLDVHAAIGDMVFKRTMRATVAQGKPGPADLGWLMPEAKRTFGVLGEEVAKDWIALAHRAVHESPWNRFRYVDWQTPIELKSLFEDAALAKAYGAFFDQRFIDFLHRNFPAIDDIHWRKFEALSAEYFQREGAQVELGPGSNDDGVDIRIWWPGDDIAKPAAMLIQCKRSKSKIGRAVLKALYADVLHEQARSGLIVTTQDLAPGTSQTRNARSYPIEAANRGTLKSWIEKMRSPHVSL